jgi:putative sigma-54 modulation protein
MPVGGRDHVRFTTAISPAFETPNGRPFMGNSVTAILRAEPVTSLWSDDLPTVMPVAKAPSDTTTVSPVYTREERSMQMVISGHHVELTDALKDYVQSKLEKVERHFDHITSMKVILSIDKLVQKAEATIHIAGADLFANAESPDMYAAIDQLTDKLDRQILKHKEKIQRRH